MGRFEDRQHPLFRRINSSIGFDLALWPYDVRQSRAHARSLREAGVLDEAELEGLLAALDAVQAELEQENFEVREDDEDVHMAIERRVTEIAGPVGGKLHTGRSRNDQVATDLAMYVRERCERAVALLGTLMEGVLALAEAHADWPMPGYTHLQRAQPIYLGHHLLAYFWMLQRDFARFVTAREATLQMPLGSGALAGLNWELDRPTVAKELGFSSVSPNSLDAVSNRDFAFDYLAAAATCATHLSRIGSEIVLWSSQEFGFAELADDFSSGSSIMPQKKNPDAAELMRAKAPRIVASLSALHGVFHGLPLAYSKDMQEDKEGLFDAAATLELCLEAAAQMLRGISFNRERLEAAASDEFLAATDIADLLVRKGMAFREAHGIVGKLVRTALAEEKALSEFTGEQLSEHSELLDDEYYEVLAGGRGLESKSSEGGTASDRLAEQLEAARRALTDLRP